jgi:hypothetical protein
MPNCSSNTLFISKSSSSCPGACSSVGPTDVINAKIGQRRNRGKVIDQIKDHVLLVLGAPVVSVELDAQALDLTVKHILSIIEYYAPREYFTYYTFTTTSGKSVYKLPDEIGYVRQVSYKEAGADFAFQSSDLQGSIPIEYFYPGGAYASIQGGLIDPIQPIWGRAGEWALYKNYERMYSRLSSGIGGWEFLAGYRHIKLYPIPFRPTHVIVHYMQRQYDWDQVTEAMIEGSIAYAKMILGNIYNKYVNIPGPSGGVQLNPGLYQQGKEEYDRWREDLINKFGDGQLAITTG